MRAAGIHVSIGMPLPHNCVVLRAREVNLPLLGILLLHQGLVALEVDDVRDALMLAVAPNGPLDKQWKRFLEQNLRKKRSRGRPRNAHYDRLFEKKSANPNLETYGKLIRELSNSGTDSATLRNRLKAAAAYRKKRGVPRKI